MEPPHIIQFQYIPTPWPHGLWRRWRLALAEAIHVAEEEVGAFHLEARLKGRKTWVKSTINGGLMEETKNNMGGS